jgi:hypothetical protein
MDQKKEIWVEEVLNSIDGITRAEAPDDIEVKILQKINAPQAKVIKLESPQFRWLAAGIVLLIGLNMVLLSQKHKNQSNQIRVNQNHEYDFGSNDLIKL